MADNIIKFAHNRPLNISQPEKGYRFSMDALLLASHVNKVEGEKTLIDIGCGCGIISIILAQKYEELKVIGIEIQKELYKAAYKNVRDNNLEKRVQIVHDDVRNIKINRQEDLADIIVTNPPFGKKGAGRLSPDPQKSIAMHEISLDLESLLECSGQLLKDKGKLFIIFPFNRRKELEQELIRHHFETKYIQDVYSKADSKPLRVIACAVNKIG